MNTSTRDYQKLHALYFYSLNVLFVLFLTGLISCSPKPEKKASIEAYVFSKPINFDTLTQRSQPLVIMSEFNRAVLVISNKKNEKNNPISGAKYNGGNDQQWRVEKRDAGYVIYSLLNDLCLSINLRDSTIEQQSFKGKDNQIWNFSGQADSLRIENKSSHLYLSMWPKKIIAEAYDESESQLWKILTKKNYLELMTKCDCLENLNFVRSTMESSYAGFPDKVNQKTRIQYDSLSAILTSNARYVSDVDTCYEIIEKYTNFFKDKHVSFKNSHGNNKIQKQLNTQNQRTEYFQIYNANDKTLILTLPNFHIENKTRINGMLEFHKEKILKTPYLILDLRNNGGGDGSWKGLIPYLYTNPISSKGNEIRATEEMISTYEKMFKEIRKSDASQSDKNDISELIQRMKDNKGKFVIRSKSGFTKLDSITKNPQKIIVLINKHCGSSCEEFILAAKQSKKVILMGQNTTGCLDYSNVFSTKCPSPAFYFGYATTKSMRLPDYSVDKEGIKPDIYLKYDQDWIKEALNEFEKL